MTHLIRVYGIVQGVGFRPTVARHASEYGIRGTVSNRGPFVEIIAQAEEADLAAFEDAVRNRSPRRAVILKIDINKVDSPEVYPDFSIIESAATKGEILISPDIAVCEDCKREMYDPANRRYLHPFINCTCCGPRLTILDALPYDRVRTSMKAFPMCPDCAAEYTTQNDRRYDAQPVCCNECGPVVYLLDMDAKPESFPKMMEEPTNYTNAGIPEKRENPVYAKPDYLDSNILRNEQKTAITRIRRTILAGGIVAIKGIGGYHLCCDATNESAVSLLRQRKHRPMKPLAVMMRDMDAVRRYCEVDAAQEEMLTGHQKPIVLLKTRTQAALCNPENEAVSEPSTTSVKAENGASLAPGIAPGNPRTGVMLPYAPVQLLLFDYDDGLSMPDALVMTSANNSGAPICRDETDAMRELAPLCDEILAHNRMIRLRADDTVMDFYEGKPYMIRRSRGFAPLPFVVTAYRAGKPVGPDKPDSMENPGGPETSDSVGKPGGSETSGSSEKSGRNRVVLGIGGELKNTFCIRVNDLCYLSPYIGDMEDVRTVNALKESIQRFRTLLEAEPEAVVCDLHPKYNTTLVAEQLGLPVYRVQHHFAHVLSCMAENNYDGTVIGVSFDGTGFGNDASIWGGEILLSNYESFERSGSIRPFRQIGGDAAAREGFRIAVSMIYGLTGRDFERTRKIAADLGLCSEDQVKVITKMYDLNMNAVVSTSVGRLFDAVSAILGIRKASTFEGEASTALQFAAEQWAEEKGAEQLQSVAEHFVAEKDVKYGSAAAEHFVAEKDVKYGSAAAEHFVAETGADGLQPVAEHCAAEQLYLTAEYSAAESQAEGTQFALISVSDGRVIMNTDLLVRDILARRLNGESSGELALYFHETLAHMAAAACIRVREEKGINTVALTGGCYQNTLLLRLTEGELKENGFMVLRHSMVPPNDGGLALGQAVYRFVP